MRLLDQIRSDALTARKQRNSIASSLLVTLLAEAEMPGINDGKRASSDTEVMATVRKFLKNNAEMAKLCPHDEVLLIEAGILENYLPQQLSEDALRQAIEQAAKTLGITTITGKETGAIMQALNRDFAGQFNGGQASALIKQLAS